MVTTGIVCFIAGLTVGGFLAYWFTKVPAYEGSPSGF
jgi:hypothetical protein